MKHPASLSKTAIQYCLLLTVVIMCCLSADAQKPKGKPSPSPTPVNEIPGAESVKWQEGPSVGNLGTNAEVKVPAGYIFAGSNDTRTLMEAMQNPPTGQEVGFVAPGSRDWFVVFEFNDVGYVKDDEKDNLDADAMLESIRAGNEEGNKERQRRGWSTMNILGWEQAPRYNDTTHNLEWAIKGESEGQAVVNYNTRLLGRSGVMKVTLVADPSILSATLPEFNKVLAGFNYKQGQKYGEVRPGDKMAEYGLSALIVGGAAAVAVKSGGLKWLWKVLVIGVIAVGGLIKKLFSGRKSE